ncbi:MAG: hypothetical protein ACKVJC_04265, partial [Flavobacteriales bacterium]
MITYKKNGISFIKAKAKQIFISSEKVRISRAVFALYLSSGDSITHAGINFNYDLIKKNIQLDRSGAGIAKAPFQDSYHQLDIY